MTKISNAVSQSKLALATAGAITILLSARHAGFMLIFVCMPLIPWIFYSIYIIAKYPEKRLPQLLKIVSWITGISIIIGMHLYYHISTRIKAEVITRKIELYITKNGKCPPNLESIDFDRDKLRESIGLYGYSCDGGIPHFYYASTDVPFDTEKYNFSTHEWNQEYD